MRVAKLAGKALVLLVASAVLWGVGGVVMGGGMLTSDPAVREWIGRASFWSLLAMLLSPALLELIQARKPLGGGGRFATAFIFMAVPLATCLLMKPDVPDAGRFLKLWLTTGLFVTAGLSVIAAFLTKPADA